MTALAATPEWRPNITRYSCPLYPNCDWTHELPDPVLKMNAPVVITPKQLDAAAVTYYREVERVLEEHINSHPRLAFIQRIYELRTELAEADGCSCATPTAIEIITPSERYL